MKTELKAKVKKAIHDHEYYGGRLHKISGAYVNVTKVTEDEECYIANVTFGNDLDRTKEIHFDVEYPKDKLKLE